MESARLFAAAALLFALQAGAQSYPSKPVRLLVGNPPGVGPDIIARGLSLYVGPKVKLPIVVENRVGADGAIGLDACAKAAPDGYTLCVGSQGNFVTNGLVNAKLPFDSVKDFVPVVHNGFWDSGLFVHATLPIKSFQELIDHAKAKPNAVSWGIFSYSGSQYFYEEYLKKSRGAPFFVVPYKAPTQMLQALAVGEVHVSVYTMEFTEPHVRAGKLRVLAVTSPERYPNHPEVPTFTELGIQLPLRTWYGTFAPAGMPRDMIGWWNAEFTRLAADPEFKAKILDSQGLKFSPNTPEEFAAFVRRNRQEMADLIKYIDLKRE